ncbi:mRNA turnover and ribosome assembly protein [Cystobasidiomycetes sp. EMM_F5]
MPRSKRQTVVALTKTEKKTKEAKGNLLDKVKQHADEFKYIWVFHIENMRTKCLQEVRDHWKGSKIMLGRNAVMRKALGATVEEEHKPGCSVIANQLEGDVGLLFTSETPQVVLEWFESYKVPDYARAGNLATEDFVLPEGAVQIDGENAPHSLEPQLRKLGLPTRLLKGIPTLSGEHRVCKEGQKLSPDQAHLLKLFHRQMATFQIVPKTCVDLEEGKVVHGDA